MQIKIRAWDKDSETMIYGVGITPESDGGIPYQIPVNAYDFDQLDYYPNSIIMLYTGLKDKNGKEIYEGDIVSTDLDRPFNIVVFRNGAFMFQCHDSGKDYYDYMFSVEEESDLWEYGEVIGNIYENPELLEGEENEAN